MGVQYKVVSPKTIYVQKTEMDSVGYMYTLVHTIIIREEATRLSRVSEGWRDETWEERKEGRDVITKAQPLLWNISWLSLTYLRYQHH